MTEGGGKVASVKSVSPRAHAKREPEPQKRRKLALWTTRRRTCKQSTQSDAGALVVNVCPRFYTTWKGSSLRVFYLKGTYIYFFGKKNQSEQNFQKIIIAPAACHAPVNRQPHPHPATQHHRVTFTTRSTG